MAIFSVTSDKTTAVSLRTFRTSNMNIHIDTLNLDISKTNITSAEWAGIYT